MSEILASSIRKKFNRRYDLSILDLVKTPDGKIGEFYGISTHNDSSKIIFLFYEIEKDVKDREVKDIPETFEYL